MGFKMKAMIVFLIISVFLLSSCEVYQTLYGQSKQTPEETVSEEETSMEEDPNMQIPEMEETDENIVDPTLEEEQMPQETETPEEVMEETPEETFEPVMSNPDEKPIVVSVEETELVSLVPDAQDPDSDSSVVFTFTSPLDEDGQWQTTYGDNGEYTVTVTASDGELTTTRDVLILVSKKEESPSIDDVRPVENALTVSETESVDFSVTASDLNNDPLSYSWKLDGVSVSESESYAFDTTYEDAGTHTVKVDVSDGISSASKIWSVNVQNVNRKPVMELMDDITVSETDTITITVVATDDDNDNIQYSISGDRFEQDGNVFTWETDYTSAGTYEVTLGASDGTDTTEQTITVVVNNVNRPPVITDIVQRR